MSAGFRAGQANDGYLQINGTDILTVSSGVLGVKNTGAQSEVRLYCESNNAHYASLKSPPHSDFIGNVTFTLPGTSGSSGQVLQTDGSGNLSWVNQSGGGGGGGVSDKMSEGNTEAEVVDTGSDGHFKVTTEGVERLRITSAGSLQVKGDANPNVVFDRGSANTTNVNFNYNGTLTGQLGAANAEFQISASGASTPLVAYVNGAERLRIDVSGNVILGYAGNSLYFQNGFNNRASRIQNGGGSGSADLKFFTNDAGTEAERLRVGPSGQIGLGGANYGTSGQVLTSGGASGAVSWTTISGGGGSYGNSDVDNHLNSGAASSGQILSWNGSDYAWVADQGGSGGGGISDVVDDTTPQLGGNLDLSSNNITGTGDIDITGDISNDTLSIVSDVSNNSTISQLGSGLLTVKTSNNNGIMLWADDSGGDIILRRGTGVGVVNTLSTTSSGVTVTGTLTATTFSGSGASLTSLPSAQLTGALPAISGANLTNLPAANLTGTLPAISGANLTNLPSDTPADTDVQVTYDISAPSSSAYRFTGPGYSGADDNPDLYLVRGQRYRFINATGGHPFQIQSNTSGTAYTDGVSGSLSGTQDFNVQHNAPERLYYQCTSHSAMIGNIYIVGASDWRMTNVATSATPEIYTNLNVGIGTDNPSDHLEILPNNGSGLKFKTTQNHYAQITSDCNRAGASNHLLAIEGHWNGTPVAEIALIAGTDTTNKDDGQIIFRTSSANNLNSNERLKITSAGTSEFTSDSSTVCAKFTGNGVYVNHAIGSEIFLGTQSGSDGKIGTTNNSNLHLFANGYGNRITVNTSGSLSINDGDLIVANGHGINFGSTTPDGTTPSSELLDDYEEGTWIPTYLAASGNITSAINQGVYVKIGSAVYFSFRLATTNVNFSGISGQVKVAGLPFSVGSSTQQRIGGGSIDELYRWPTNFANFRGYPEAGTPAIGLHIMNPNSSSYTNLGVTDMNTGTNQNIIAMSGWYSTTNF